MRKSDNNIRDEGYEKCDYLLIIYFDLLSDFLIVIEGMCVDYDYGL